MTGKEALENISIEFDEYGFVPTTTTPRKEEHFTEWWKKEYEIINKELEKKEKLEKNYDKYKRAFEILKEGKVFQIKKVNFDRYAIVPNKWSDSPILKEEYELLEELMKGEEIR